jgi:hypothetical protein
MLIKVSELHSHIAKRAHAYYARTSNHIGGALLKHNQVVHPIFLTSERERERDRAFHDYERPIEADPIFETCQPLRQARRPQGHGSRISCKALSHPLRLTTR